MNQIVTTNYRPTPGTPEFLQHDPEQCARYRGLGEACRYGCKLLDPTSPEYDAFNRAEDARIEALFTELYGNRFELAACEWD